MGRRLIEFSVGAGVGIAAYTWWRMRRRPTPAAAQLRGARQPGGVERLAAEGVRKGQMLAHFETLDAMASGVEAGKTFTQALDDFNRSNGHVQRT